MKKLFILLLTFILLLCSFGLVACSECEHEKTQKSTIIEATCTQTGLEKTTCSDCGKILEEKTLSKLSHTASDWITDSEANCKNAGLRHKKCSDCESILEIDIVSDLFEHNYVYGECEICGAIDSNYMTKGLIFALINNDTEYAVGGYVGEETDVIIPAIYRGKPVTVIGDSAFENSLLTSIVLPNSVTSIGSSAFRGCTSLISIEIPNSVTSIGEDAFEYCRSLTSIVLPNSVTSIGEGAFDGCNNLQYNIEGNLKYLGNNENKYLYLAGTTSDDITSATINPNCKLIAEGAFWDCTSLTSIVIPNSVTSIGEGAFYDCSSLTSIVIPNSVTSIGNHAFDGCNNLQYNIEGNLKYLGNNENKYLYLAGATSDDITSVTINPNCRFIGESAFWCCTSLTSIEIPDSVTSIGNCAFYYCTSLISIEIPNSVTSIGEDAFADCDSLTIYCEAESKPSGWNLYWNPDDRPVVWGYKGNN